MIFSILVFTLILATIIILLLFFIRVTFEGFFGILADIKKPIVKLSKIEKQIAGILERSLF